MGEVVSFPNTPVITTPTEWAHQRMAAGEIRGPGIWVDEAAVARMELALVQLYNLGLEAGKLPKQTQDKIAALGGITPSVVEHTALDALVWFTMAWEINRHLFNNPAPEPPG